MPRVVACMSRRARHQTREASIFPRSTYANEISITKQIFLINILLYIAEYISSDTQILRLKLCLDNSLASRAKSFKSVAIVWGSDMIRIACKVFAIGALTCAATAEAAETKAAPSPVVQAAPKLTRAHARIDKAKASRLTQLALIGVVVAGAGAAVGIAAAAGSSNSSN